MSNPSSVALSALDLTNAKGLPIILIKDDLEKENEHRTLRHLDLAWIIHHPFDFQSEHILLRKKGQISVLSLVSEEKAKKDKDRGLRIYIRGRERLETRDRKEAGTEDPNRRLRI